MPYIKTPEEIELIKQGGKLLGEILQKLVKMAKPGVSTWKIDQKAEELIKKAGGLPSFKGYKSKKSEKPFPSTICACLNEELVHAVPGKDKILKNGDVFSIDIGMAWPCKTQNSKLKTQNLRSYFTDTSITVAIGEVTERVKELLRVTKEALEVGIKAVKVGNSVADIGKTIEEYVKSQGNYGIVRDLVGHGVGHDVHEEPRVPNYYDKNLEKWKLEPGVVLAIEPMITLGGYEVETAPDSWGICTKDKCLCAHFEHTVVITNNGPMIVTRRPEELK